MTATTTDFDVAAQTWHFLKAAQADTDAKLNVPEPPVLKHMLDLLVALGYINVEQAHHLWEVLTAGGYTPLPPIPFPEAVTGKVTIYDLLRRYYTAHAEDAQFDILDVLSAIGHGIAAVVEFVAGVGPAVEHLIDAIVQQLGG